MRTFTDDQKARALASLGPLPADWRPVLTTLVDQYPQAAGVSRQQAARFLATKPKAADTEPDV
jgi:hypothetical protein